MTRHNKPSRRPVDWNRIAAVLFKCSREWSQTAFDAIAAELSEGLLRLLRVRTTGQASDPDLEDMAQKVVRYLVSRIQSTDKDRRFRDPPHAKRCTFRKCRWVFLDFVADRSEQPASLPDANTLADRSVEQRALVELVESIRIYVAGQYGAEWADAYFLLKAGVITRDDAAEVLEVSVASVARRSADTTASVRQRFAHDVSA